MSYIGSPAAPTIATVSDDTITTAKIVDDAVTDTKISTLSGDLNFGDNAKANFGASNDLQIYHDGSNSYVSDEGTGTLRVRSSNQLVLQVGDGAGGWENAILADNNAGVALRYNNSTKLSTTGTGVDVTGDIASSTGFFKRDGNNYVYVGASSYVGAVVNGSERMRIDNNGKVGIGTTAAIGPGMLQIKDTHNVGNLIGLWNPNGTSGSFGQIRFANNANNAIVGSITRVNDSSIAYNTTSDYRLKENVVEVTDGIDRIKLLKPSKFNFIADPSTTVDGFLAHEVQDIVPEAITGTKDGMRTEDVYDEDGNVTGTQEVPDYQGIDQSKLVPLLTAALQEAIAKIETLEARVATLESA